MSHNDFLTDVQTLRARARESIGDGARTSSYCGVGDPTTRTMLERILAEEEDHATDMHDLLVAHQGRPFLPAA